MPKLTEIEWLASTGPTCSECGKEFFKGRDGMCMPCWEKEHEFEYRVPEEFGSLIPMSVIKDIVHKARKIEP